MGAELRPLVVVISTVRMPSMAVLNLCMVDPLPNGGRRYNVGTISVKDFSTFVSNAGDFQTPPKGSPPNVLCHRLTNKLQEATWTATAKTKIGRNGAMGF